MGAAMLKKPERKKNHLWTVEEEVELVDLADQGVAIKDIAAQMGFEYTQVQTKLHGLRKNKPWLFSPQEKNTPGPIEDAHNWQGGSYWRLAPKQTWHKGITGRLVHLAR